MPRKTQSKQFDPLLVVFDLYGDEITPETKPQYSQWYLRRNETFDVNRPNEFKVTTDGINSVFQYSETKVMHFIFNLLIIK
jgi:hypothetical protein